MNNLSNKKKVGATPQSKARKSAKSRCDETRQDYKKLPFNLVFKKGKNGLHFLKYNDASDKHDVVDDHPISQEREDAVADEHIREEAYEIYLEN